MSNLVRAKHPNGGEFTTSEAYAKRKGLVTVDKPAEDRFGRIIPPKKAGEPVGGGGTNTATPPPADPKQATKADKKEGSK